VRHDAVVWGLAKGNAKLGVHIHQGTEVAGIGVKNGKVAWVDTDKGRIQTTKVLKRGRGLFGRHRFQLPRPAAADPVSSPSRPW